MRSSWPVVALLLVAACRFDAGGVGGDDPPGDDVPPIDAAASDGAPPGPDGAACVPGCLGDQLISCPGSTPSDCALGCSEVGAPHCQAMVPSNGVPLSGLDDVTADLGAVAEHFLVVSTNDGAIADYDAGAQPPTLTAVRAAGTGVVVGIRFQLVGNLAVITVDSLDIAGGGGLIVEGARPLVILSRGDINIGGVVDVAGGCFFGNTYVRSCGGPGGGAGARNNSDALAGGCGPGANSLYFVGAGQETGAGGGAMATDGAASGTAQSPNLAPGGSSASCADADLVPLVGGSGGGAAQLDDVAATWAHGGGGGGALQLSSLTQVTVQSIDAAATWIDATGEGGARSDGDNDGGGGGGSGGAVLIEAPDVVLAVAGIYAGGGAGGAGRPPSSPTLAAPGSGNGERGKQVLAVALGGLGSGGGNDDGRGGNGGVDGTAPSAGDGGQDGTGGGGGAVGRLRVNTMPGQLTEISFATTASYTKGTIILE